MTDDELLESLVMGHTDLQMDYFITRRSGYTDYGMLRQALMELKSRRDSINQAEIELEEAQCELDLLKFRASIRLGRWKRAVQSQIKKVELRHRDILSRRATHVRELQRFRKQAVSLKSRLGDLTPSRCRLLEEDFWLTKLACRAAVDVLSTGRVQGSTWELIRSLPNHLSCSLEADIRAQHTGLVENSPHKLSLDADSQ